MKNWKRIATLSIALSACSMLAIAAPAPGQGQRGERGARMAQVREEVTPLAAQAIAQYVGLTEDKAKAFVEAYVAEAEKAQKKMTELREQGGGDREAMMTAFRESRESMQAMLKKHLDEKQYEKAEVLVGMGRFGTLDRSIQVLLMQEVEKAKVEKALPVLTGYAADVQGMMAKVRAQEMEMTAAQEKMTAAREAAAKKLAPIVGEEAANAWQERSGMRGMRGMGGGAGQGRRGAGAGGGAGGGGPRQP
jgi:hypothetical protein